MVKRSGKPVSVIISLEQYLEFIEAIEELDDIAAAEESLREKDQTFPGKKSKKT